MGASVLGFIVWTSLLMASNYSSVLARIVNTTLHSTHPQVSYSPESYCAKALFGECRKRYDPFTMSTYVDSSSMKRTFFQTNSRGNEPTSSDMTRRAEISFHGRAVYIYGPPPALLDNLPGRIQLSMDGELLETIDLEKQYRERDQNTTDRRLLYQWKSNGRDASHVLQISLLDSATGIWKWRPIRGFGLDSVVYTSDLKLPPKYELKEFEKLENITLHDTSFAISFKPPFSREIGTSNGTPALGVQSFHATSNELAHNSRALTPVAEFSVHCTSLAIFGASPAQLKATFGGGFRHGHTQICLGQRCDYVDLHQAYLNVPVGSWNEPVLLYNNDRIRPGVEKSVTMKFFGPPSRIRGHWIMSFSHAICSQVAQKRPPTPRIPAVAYHSVPFLAAAISFFLLLYAKWPFPRPGPNPHPPLIHNERCAPPSYVPYGARDTALDPPPRPHDPITEPAFISQRSKA